MPAAARSIATALCIALLASACGELVTDPPLQGTLRVRATSRQGAPLPGIQAILYNNTKHFGYAWTDADGNATFHRVSMGTYGIYMSLPAEHVGFDEVGLGPRNDVAVPLTVSSGSDTTLRFTFLRRGVGEIVVTVEDSTATPVHGLLVHLYNSNAVLHSVLTDASGQIVFDGLPFGAYGLWTQPPDSLGVHGSPPIVRDTGLFIDRGHVAQVKFVVPRCRGQVRVRVLDQALEPVIGYPVSLYTAVAVRATIPTGADGRAHFPDVPCGGYGAYVIAQPGFSVDPTLGNGFDDGLTVPNNGLVETTLRVTRLP
jgi:hypothetical protein